MKKKTLLTLGACALAMGAVAGAVSARAATEAKAATETTVYYSIAADKVGTYTVKLNTNQQTNPDSWIQYTMTLDEETYNGNPIYKATFTDLWDGVDHMQFQLYDGETWKSQEEVISSWESAATYNGKMWVEGGSGWVNYPDGGGETPTPTPTEDPVYYVSGSFNSWAKTSESYKMSLSDEKKDGKDQYYLSLEGLVAGQEFKVTDGDKGWYPSSNVAIPKNGDYTIFYVPEGNVTGEGWIDGCVYLNLDKEGGDVEIEYFAVGTFNEWKQKDADYKLTKTTEQKEGHDQYTIDLDGLAAGAKLKVMSSVGVWYPSGDDYEVSAAGDYTLYFVPEGVTAEDWYGGFFYLAAKEDPEPPVTVTNYYAVGTFNEWKTSDEYKLEKMGEQKEEKDQYKVELEGLHKDDELKITDGDKAWFPGDGVDNYVIPEDGDYTVYFVPDGVAAEDWYEGFFYVAKKGEPEPPAPTGDYIYISTADGATSTKLYTWSGEEPNVEEKAPWPGEEINTIEGVEVTMWTNFNEKGGLWKVPASALKDKFIVTITTGEGEFKTGDLVTAGGVYVAPAASATDAVLGPQAEVVFDIQAAIGATAHRSVCEVTKEKATELVAEYDALTKHDTLDASKYYTYKGVYKEGLDPEKDEMDNWDFSAIVAELRATAESGVPSAWNIGSTTNNTTLVVTLLVVGGGIVGAVALYLISKKRRLQK